jgi:hypothetical protein
VATRSTRTTTTKTLVQDRPATGLHIGPDKALDVADLLPAVRAAFSALTSQGRNLTRAALTERLRAAGHTVSNVRASVLVKILSVDLSYGPRRSNASSADPGPVPARPES